MGNGQYSTMSLPISDKKLTALLELLQDVWNNVDQDQEWEGETYKSLPRMVSGWKESEDGKSSSKEIDGVMVTVSRSRIYISVEQ